MLEHVPHWLGHALQGLRAGTAKLAIVQPDLGLDPATSQPLELTSLAFPDGGRLPDRFTADGEGVSPPLAWRDPPPGTASLALLVEDADSPTPQPLVHAVIWGLAPAAGQLTEGMIVADDGEGDGIRNVGRNSYARKAWLPPDPPTGHGEHRYAFQLFALDAATLDPGSDPGRSALIEAMAGHVLAAGLLTGTYSREDEAPVGAVGAGATA